MSYYLVLDTITHRVIHFSNESIVAEGENSYLAQASSLPAGMTPENCWEYRFHGGALSHSPGKPHTPVTSAQAVFSEAKYELRKTVIDRAQKAFHRKVPLNALAYIATLDAARKWLADQPLEPVELRFIPSREKAQEFMALHHDNLQRALDHYIPMVKKLDAIDAATDAAELERVVP